MFNISTTQAEVVKDCWVWAAKGFDTLTRAAQNATDLVTVREAMVANDEQLARRMSQGE